MKNIIFLLLFLFTSVYVFSQQPVFVTDASGNLYSLDLFNCTSRLIANSGAIFEDIAFTPDGKLWGVNGDALFQIDTSTASITYIGLNNPATFSESLVALNDSTLLGEFNSILYGISTKDAQSYEIGSLGEYSACGDLTWYKDTLYMSGCEQLIKIVLNSTYTSVLKVTPVGSIPEQIYGLATISFNGSDSIIGFTNKPYRISTIGATTLSICNNIVIPVNGAASLSYPSALPIYLLNFNSTLKNNNVVKLQWETTSEINSNYFLIERSADGINYSLIGKITAAGNSSSLQQYTFIDNSPLAFNYYRLKEVDFDEKYFYSKILQVNIRQTQPLIIIGNPVQNSLKVQINNESSQINYLSIFDMARRRLKILNLQSGSQNINVSSLKSGFYILQLITHEGQIFNQEFVKIE